MKIQARCKSADWKLPVEIKYTAKDTPQQIYVRDIFYHNGGSIARHDDSDHGADG